MTYYNEIPTIEGKIKDLERRISTIETAPRLSSSSISSGGLTVKDGGGITIIDGGSISVNGGSLNIDNGGELTVSGPTTLGGPTSLSSTLTVGNGGDMIVRGGRINVQNAGGFDQVRMGLLANGTYGVEQLVGSNWIPLLQLASGVKSATVSTIFDQQAPANTASAWEYPGPSVAFTTYTGQVTVITTSNVNWDGYKSGVIVGYRIRTPSGAVVVGADGNRASVIGNPSEISASQTAIRIDTQTISPGDYILDAAYQVGAGFSTPVYAQFSARTVMVFPY